MPPKPAFTAGRLVVGDGTRLPPLKGPTEDFRFRISLLRPDADSYRPLWGMKTSSHRRGRASAVGSANRPSLQRAAAGKMRRFQTSRPRLEREGSTRSERRPLPCEFKGDASRTDLANAGVLYSAAAPDSRDWGLRGFSGARAATIQALRLLGASPIERKDAECRRRARRRADNHCCVEGRPQFLALGRK